MKEIDARHLACPGPVIELRRELEAGAVALRILVADQLAVSNVSRFAAARGASVASEAAPGSGFAVTITAAAGGAGAASPDRDDIRCEVADGADASRGPLVVQIASATAGIGDDELGALLLRSFVKTLLQVERRPDTILCYNSGVTLCCEGSPLLDDLARLVADGVELLACGTCLNYYGLTQKLAVGRVTDMLEIVTRLTAAARVVRP